MKGKTIIELKDVKSGKVQRVEHGNTFQSAVLEKLFSPRGAFNLSMISASSEQWKSLVGGLLVFDDTIEVGTQYPPAGVGMTANGSYQVVNTGDPVELGSWNESESYVSANEIVMTYDFTTSQGNGKINSVCLTSNIAGKAGVGNASQTKLASGLSVPYIGSVYNFGGVAGDNPFFDGEYIYKLERSGTALTVTRWWANTTGIDLIKGLSNTDYTDTYTLTLPRAFSSWVQVHHISETKVAFVEKVDSETIEACVVDVKTRNVSNIMTIPNIGALNNDTIGAVSGSNTLLVYQWYTSESVQYLGIYDAENGKWLENAEVLNNIYGNVRKVYKIGSRYYIQDDRNFSCIFDGKLQPTNMNFVVGSNSTYSGWYLPTLDRLQGGEFYAGYGHFLIPAMYLATINNLESEIVKDNTKTMKITYVLTRR